MLILYIFKNNSKILFVLLLVSILSCSKEVNYEIKHKSKLVVNATLNEDGIFVTVSKSISPLTALPSAEKLKMQDALVTLKYSNNVLLNLENKGDGNFSYADTSLLKEGIEYELKVTAPGFETATSRVLNKNLHEIPQDGASRGVELFTDDGQRLQTYDIKVKNSLDDDYYFVRHNAVSTIVGDFIYNLYGFTEFINIIEPPCDYTVINAVKGISPYFVISDGCFGSSQYINESIYVNEEIDGGQSDPQEVIIEISACSKEYFNYLKAKKRTEFDADSNNFPDISPGNIVNGFGFFRILKTRKFIF